MQTAGTHTQTFVDGLNAKHADYGTFTVRPGKKYDKVAVTPNNSTQTHVYAFLDIDGNVYKAAGWAAPAKGVRYSNVADALAASDPYGSFLYKR